MADVAGSRWVITGAAGTIGSALREALFDLDVELVSTDVRPVVSMGEHDEVVSADLDDLDALVELFGGADGVIHLGGIPDEADFHDLAEVNIVGTYHVLEAALPASSGNTVRHRLNRGGDRRLKRALHTITMTRMVHDPETREYVTKRTQEGRRYREIRRSLKRYVARTLYRQLNALYMTAEPDLYQAQ